MADLLLIARAPVLSTLTQALAAHHDVAVAGSIAAARALVARRPFDLVVLDVDQPDGEGLQLLVELRHAGDHVCVPILIVTARADVANKVLGFAVGCDDWLAASVDPLELRARVNHLLRKHRAQADVALDGLRIDLFRQRAWLTPTAAAPRPLELTATELKLLVHFATRVDAVIDRDQLLAAVWGHDVEVLDRTVDTHVSHLRRKLAESPWTIEAVPRLGYRFSHVH